MPTNSWIRKHREEKIQIEICQWMKAKYPEVEFRSDGGGLRLPIGLAKKFKSMQKSRAWPDLFIAEPRGGYMGLFLEVKADHRDLFLQDMQTLRGSRHIQEQWDKILKLRKRGYAAYFAVGFNGCASSIRDYLEGDLIRPTSAHGE
jgi:hypothetical protein